MIPALRQYRPPGPVARRFIAEETASVACLMGPVGSGGTSAALMKCAYWAAWQAPHPRDGIRRTRWIVIRRTYRDMERALLRTHKRWFPPDGFDGQVNPATGFPINKFTGGTGGQPAQHQLSWDLADGTTVETEFLFGAIGDQDIEDFFRGFEFTGAVFDEFDLMEPEAIDMADQRVGRYPEVDAEAGFAGATRVGIWGKMNAPSVAHWTYRRFVEEPLDGYALFRQPGGLDPGAENLPNLRGGRDYYHRIAKGKEDWWVKRFVHNRWGYSRAGKPVFPEFNEDLHISKTKVPFVPAWTLQLGIDGGRTPCAIAAQTAPNGQRRLIGEYVTDGAGATTFGRGLKRWLATEFPGARVKAWADPATGFAARDDEAERSWMVMVAAEAGLPIRPAPGNNELPVRLEAVRQELVQLIDGAPALLVSPVCKVTIRGFLADYRFKKIQGSGGQYQEKPEKLHPVSDVMDAVQYVCLGDGGYAETLGRKSSGAAPVIAAHDFKVM